MLVRNQSCSVLPSSIIPTAAVAIFHHSSVELNRQYLVLVQKMKVTLRASPAYDLRALKV